MQIKELAELANQALQAAYQVHDSLGAAGLERVRHNQFGESAMRIDIEAEAAVLAVLRDQHLPILVLSEEHGTTAIEENPSYTGILDGLDGSDVYQEQRRVGRYSTMFGIYQGTDPSYKDYLYGGIMEHAQKRLFFASRGHGSWLLQNGVCFPLHCSDVTHLEPASTRLYADLYYDQVYHTDVLTSLMRSFAGYQVQSLRSSAAHYADVTQGAVDGVIECTRKGNLEIAVAFPLVNEAGGVMVDQEGVSLGEQRYRVFGQTEHIPVITAGTSELAGALVGRLRN